MAQPVTTAATRRSDTRHDSERPGRCGKSLSAPAAASPTSTPDPCMPRTPPWPLRNARDLYTRRNEGVSIWVVPATPSSPAIRTPRARSSSPPGQGLPPRHVLHQERGREAPVSAAETTRPRASGRPAATRRLPPPASPRATPCARRTSPASQDRPSEDVAEYALRLGDDALILAQRLGHWISRGAGARRGRRPGQHRPGPAGPRPVLPDLRRRCAWGKTEDDLAYFRSEDEFRSAAARRAAQRGLRQSPSPGSWSSLLPVRAVLAAGGLHRRHPGRHRRQGRQGSGLPPRPRDPVDPAPGPGHRGVAPPDAATGSRSSGRTWTSCSATTTLHRPPGATGVAVAPSGLRADFDRIAGGPRRGRRWRSRRSRPPLAADAAAGTPSTWATSWPRCRCWPASTPAPPGSAWLT